MMIMKKLHYTLAALLVSSLAMAQGPTTTENYIYNTTYQVKTQDGTTNAETQQPLTEDDKIESITYFDGLGRPKQSISRQAGGNKQDILVPIVYDSLGRQVKEYLPYANPLQNGSNSSLGFVNPTNLLSDLNAYYIAKYPTDINGGAPNPYSEKRFEASPLNRVLEQGAPGYDWRVDTQSDTDHTIKFEYKTNSAYEVAYYKVIFPTGNTEQPQLFYSGLYQANQLYKTITKDENWKPSDLKNHTTEEFKDKQGRVILKRTYTNQVPHDTYYVYDDFANLTYVLSPKGSDLVLTTNGYKNYDETFACDYLVPLDKDGEKTITDCTGQIVIKIDDVNLDLTVEMNASFNMPINLRNGPIVQLDTTIANMIVGTITTGGVNYIVSIQDGFLHISGSGVLSSISETLIVSLPTYSVQTNIVNDLCYQYHYDYRNRLVEKKIPQKGWEYIVYDKLDRPVLTQDEYQRLNDPTKKGWLFTKYDAFGRVAFTGQHLSNLTRVDIQAFVNSNTVLSETSSSTPTNINGVSLYYTNNVYPQNTLTVYTINYYDTYNPELSAAFSNPNVVLGTPVSTNTKTLPTGSKVRVLGTNDWTTTVSYYDEKGQPIYVGSKNTYLNTTDIIKTQLDFVGKVLKTESSHTKDSNSAIIVTDNFTYDHTGRLLTQKQQIGTGNIETIVNNTYDELGQLVSKGVGSIEASPLQVVDYKYNIRGWLKSINDKSNLGTDLFAFGINYNTTELGQTNTPLYNGNISETTWKTANDVSTNTTRGYAYSYDALNRLTTANMSINTGSGFSIADGYHENGFNYDKNGNILSLQRVGAVDIFDNLTYFYNGNQLTKVNDAITNQQTEGFIDGNTTGDDYSYDTNGNMIEDKNKNITSITYNHLNLPTQIQIANQGNIVYTYDATGTKLSKTVNPLFGTYQSTFYAGNYIYETLAGNPILKFFNHPEGYVEPDGQGGYNYVYQHKDIWDNVRLTYSDDNNDGSVNSSEIRMEQNYYPYGLEHRGYNGIIQGIKNNLKTFQGQEFTEDLGLNTHEWKYRVSDPAIGRFWQIDPLAEDYTYNSTYALQENKMGMGVELEGLELVEWFMDKVWHGAMGQPRGGNMNTHFDNTPTSIGPTKNITGNYFGDAAYKLLGGETISKAIDGDKRAQGQVIMNTLVSLAPGARGIGDDVIENATTKSSNFVFRGDTRNPSDIFENSFTSKGGNFNLLDHAGGLIDDSGFISTSTSPSVARNFAGKGGFVFTIDAPKNGLGVNVKLGTQSPYPIESEIAFPLEIPSSNIQGARQVGSDGKFVGPFIKNPNN